MCVIKTQTPATADAIWYQQSQANYTVFDESAKTALMTYQAAPFGFFSSGFDAEGCVEIKNKT